VASDYADVMYFISRGTVKMIDDDIIFRTLMDGSHFGEYEVMEHIPRLYSARTDKRCEFLVMTKEVMGLVRT
jgi:CRP-like cAMP-binding protein